MDLFSRRPKFPGGDAPHPPGLRWADPEGPRMRTVLLWLTAWLLAVTLPTAAQDPLASPPRARASSPPISVELPSGWESFSGDPRTPGELLHLQTLAEAPWEASVSLSCFTLPKVWDHLIRRERYLLLAHWDAPVLTDEALTLRGVKGHKWVYRAPSTQNPERELLHYRLYLALPATVGSQRLLVLHGIAPAESTPEMVPLFNALARSLSWGT